jgi:hypothetical protein
MTNRIPLYYIPDDYHFPSPLLIKQQKEEFYLKVLSRMQINQPRKIYALNGFLYPLPLENVEHVWRWNWNNKQAEEFAKTIKEDCILIGFSDGATASLTVAQNSPFVKKVYCHSCMYSSYPFKRKFDVSFFTTIGDSTPTFEGTEKTFHKYLLNGYKCGIIDLRPEPIKSWNPIHLMMNRKNHHFTNCIKYLPK